MWNIASLHMLFMALMTELLPVYPFSRWYTLLGNRVIKDKLSVYVRARRAATAISRTQDSLVLKKHAQLIIVKFKTLTMLRGFLRLPRVERFALIAASAHLSAKNFPSSLCRHVERQRSIFNSNNIIFISLWNVANINVISFHTQNRVLLCESYHSDSHDRRPLQWSL